MRLDFCLFPQADPVRGLRKTVLQPLNKYINAKNKYAHTNSMRLGFNQAIYKTESQRPTGFLSPG